jgi:hypothetical protein
LAAGCAVVAASACGCSVDAQKAGDGTTGQPLAYFYGDLADGGVIYGVPAGGGTPVKLLSGDLTHEIGETMTFDAQNIYYSSQDSVASTDVQSFGQSFSYSLHSAPIAGGASTTLASLLYGISGIAVSSDSVYFGAQTGVPSPSTDLPPWEIHRVPIGGGAQQVIATVGRPSIAIDSAYVYWTGGQYLLKAPIGGGTTVTIASGLDAQDIAVDATGVYWIDYGTTSTDCTSNDGSLWELATGSSTPVTLASSLHAPGSLAVRDADVYWSEGGSFCNVPQTPLGSVFKRAGATGATSTVASAIFDPANLYVGGSLLYFTQVTDPSNGVLAPTVTKL